MPTPHKKKLVALGDSVVWGQGHHPQDKFASLVCKHLGLDPEPVMKAHSGARIHPKKKLTSSYGEVPLESQGILDQVDAAKREVDPEDVAIVLLNGGINDVPVSTIIGGPQSTFDRDTPKAFDQFPELLTGSLEAFRQARVVCLGYYPIVSEDTPDALKLHALVQLGPPHVARAVEEQLAEDDERPEPVIELYREELTSMPERCKLFVAIAESKMREAVEHSAGRAVFATPRWKPEFSLNDPALTHLWLGVNDPLFLARAMRFLAHSILRPNWPLSTIVASFGHPNAAGSRDYAEAILEALKQ